MVPMKILAQQLKNYATLVQNDIYFFVQDCNDWSFQSVKDTLSTPFPPLKYRDDHHIDLTKSNTGGAFFVLSLFSCDRTHKNYDTTERITQIRAENKIVIIHIFDGCRKDKFDGRRVDKNKMFL